MKIILYIFLYWLFVTTIQKIQDKIDDLIDKYKTKKNKDKKREYTSHENVMESWTERFEKREEWNKKHPIQAKIKNIIWWIKSLFWYRVPRYPRDTYRAMKRFIQRGKRGWCDEDVWGLDYHFAKVIIGSLKRYNKIKHGVPCGSPNQQAISLGEDTDSKGMKKAIKDWTDIINNIIWTFETSLKISEREWLIPFETDKYFTSSERKRFNKFCKEMNKKYDLGKYHIMTKKEVDKYRQGWKYFQQYFGDLWD